MLLSTAIISARMSRIGWVTVSRLRGYSWAHCSSYLWYSLVVDANQLSWLRVDLQGLVEAKGGVNGVGACWGWMVSIDDDDGFMGGI